MKASWVEFVESCPIRIGYQLLDLWENISLQIKVEIRLLGVDDLREVLETHFVCIFEFSVIFRLVLDGVVSQMDESITNIVEVVLSGASSNIAILITVPFQRAVNTGHHAVNSEVKFSFVDQKRVVNILLDDEGTILLCGPSDNVLNFSHVLYDLNALSTICILARLDYPSVFRSSVFSSNCLNLFLFVRFVVALVVNCLFLRLLSLFVILFDSFLGHLFASLDLVLQVVVVAHKFPIFRVMDSLGGMESQWQNFEWIFSEHFIVLSHVDEDSFLVCKLLIILHPIVEFDWHNYPVRF